LFFENKKVVTILTASESGASILFEGIILSMTGIAVNTSASLNGPMLAQSAVILDGNRIAELD